ncbi:IQ calmodulin-binding motif-containing protein 1-like isoform X2 [Betta splendens]|uniref:IQ calmodulin-binding motif-containing protein 1-like isoform X2 n=1 Tax=Betta splendens TaxID=158456 RepID=A0A6P7NZH0_BETSP|nr:IQ calmodulin-binding motif-containing protein 1-like isoform X2 [Betta splendens]
MSAMMQEVEALVLVLKKQMEDQDLNPEQKINLLNNGLTEALNAAALQPDSSALVRVKSLLYESSVLSHCVSLLDPRRLPGLQGAVARLAQLTSSCCVGMEPSENLVKTFYRLFLPSVMDSLLSLASQLMRQAECMSLFRKVMDSVAWLLRAHTQLTTQVLSSTHYEQIQMWDDVVVSLLCIQLWVQTCITSRDFLLGLSDDSILLLLNEAVGQLAVNTDSNVGAASVRLILLMANQLDIRFHPLLLKFRGLDSLLDKDWRGRGFDQDVDQLIALIQSERGTLSHLQADTEHVRAACVIQAAWRSYQTRRRIKSLNRVVSSLQRRYRAQRQKQQQQDEARRHQELLKYQVCVRRQQARRLFHQKQRQLLQQLPPDQVQVYLQECERRAAVVIQSYWRGFRERQRYNDKHGQMLRQTSKEQEQAARVLQRAVRHFLQKPKAASVPVMSFWIGQTGLTDSRRAELQSRVQKHVAGHPSPRVSPEECERLHEKVQQLLLLELQKGEKRRREEERMEVLLAHTHTQLDLLRDAPPLSVVTEKDAEAFISPSGSIAARARDAHNAMLQAGRLPWWKNLGKTADGLTPNPLEELEAECALRVTGPAGVSRHRHGWNH